MAVCFSTAYLPPIAWFQALKRYDTVTLEAQESWQKQSYRNRCYILGPNGRQMLNIPILHNENKEHMGRVEISYAEDWQHRHWQALKTAYGSAPFFEVLAPALQEHYESKTARLFDWNHQLIELCLHWLQMSQQLIVSRHWQADYEEDYRELIHPKRKHPFPVRVYPQVFDDVMPFTPNLSIIDLLMNEGPAAFDYL